MKTSISILSIENDLLSKIKLIEKTSANYIHLDIMDGLFVPNKTWNFKEISKMLEGINKPLDVHLMVSNLDSYIPDFVTLNPEIITFHYEATNELEKWFKYLKEKNIKIGLSIKPATPISFIEPYLSQIDLVLVMSVEPGYGGQKFIDNSLNKVKYLKDQKEKNNYHYIIEVDGGINKETFLEVKKCGADMVVSGSYVTSSNDYEEKIKELSN